MLCLDGGMCTWTPEGDRGVEAHSVWVRGWQLQAVTQGECQQAAQGTGMQLGDTDVLCCHTALVHPGTEGTSLMSWAALAVKGGRQSSGTVRALTHAVGLSTDNSTVIYPALPICSPCAFPFPPAGQMCFQARTPPTRGTCFGLAPKGGGTWRGGDRRHQ